MRIVVEAGTFIELPERRPCVMGEIVVAERREVALG